MSLRHCFAWNVCLVCVHVNAGRSGVSGELRAMGAEYAGHSAACCMLARAIDGVSREVPCLLRILYRFCHVSALVS